jgi:hypothetical protein
MGMATPRDTASEVGTFVVLLAALVLTLLAASGLTAASGLPLLAAPTAASGRTAVFGLTLLAAPTAASGRTAVFAPLLVVAASIALQQITLQEQP